MSSAPAPLHCAFPMEAGRENDVPVWRCQVCPRVEPRSTNPICDFCSATPVVANEVARDFLVNPGPMGQSWGAWGACQTCHDLVEKQDWMGLEDRAYEAMRRKFPGSSKKTVRHAVQQIQRQFRIHAGA